MRFIKLSLVTAAALATSVTFANEHGAPPAGEHGGGAEAAPPRDQKEFGEKTVKANGLASKVEEARKHFEELVKEKEEAKTAAAKIPILKEMVEVTKQRDKDQHELDKLKSELAQRYPNQGAHVNRHVEKPHGHGHGSAHESAHDAAAAPEHGAEPAAHHEAPAPEHGHGHAAAAAPEHHAEAKPAVAAPTLDDLLDESKRLIDAKYAPFLPKTPAVGPRAPASVEGKRHPVRLRLEQ